MDYAGVDGGREYQPVEPVQMDVHKGEGELGSVDLKGSEPSKGMNTSFMVPVHSIKPGTICEASEVQNRVLRTVVESGGGDRLAEACEAGSN